jgi:hypothetical protein
MSDLDTMMVKKGIMCHCLSIPARSVKVFNPVAKRHAPF